ncbi:acyl--CoA ligase [Lysinibacillus contaminans]|uniref:Acyl--CoA ligase n=1 Tax=Lysinibacillus contaminans TaxID=1293441 RepID=A0ABR5JXP8_9BACI|nr:acyl--CoA ligase [Lysinibacillus contaminans]KOS66855.1 acyl--CoA ligase [Lysinibacillus contaminans]
MVETTGVQNVNLIAPEHYNITQELEKYASDSERQAIRWTDAQGTRQTLSYEQLINHMNQYANALTSLGIEKGDRALIIIPRLPEAYCVYLACLKAGIVPIPCSEMLRANDLEYRINHANAKTVITYHAFTSEINCITSNHQALNTKLVIGQDEEGWITLDTLASKQSTEFEAVPTHRDDMAFLSYTSGTTGKPKGVVHSHGWGYAHIRMAASNWLAVREGDLVWATAAPGWQKWIWSPFLSTIMLGATAFVYHGGFDANKYLQLIQDEKINVLCCTPTEYRIMAKLDQLGDYDLSSLRSAVSAGEPLNRPVIDTFLNLFNLKVRDGYGQTENTLLIGTMENMDLRPGSMGKPTPGNNVKIIDPEGKEVAPGEVGDIAVHKSSPALFKEYYNEHERTQAAFRGDWYITGDQAKYDEDGYFWFEGRGDDIIISSGYTIGPFEVEDALNKHEAVQECAVVAAPDEIRGSIVKAYVVLKAGFETRDPEQLTKELQEHVKTLTAPYKYPRQIAYLQDLPKTTSGKIRRIELRSH